MDAEQRPQASLRSTHKNGDARRAALCIEVNIKSEGIFDAGVGLGRGITKVQADPPRQFIKYVLVSSIVPVKYDG